VAPMILAFAVAPVMPALVGHPDIRAGGMHREATALAGCGGPSD
jgi:hypothetical protein